VTEPARICWAVSDGRRGIENQVLGLAEAVGRLIPLTIRRKIAPRETSKRKVIASRLRGARLADLQTPSNETPSPEDETPDLWIGCGRMSLRYAAPAREAFGKRTFIVQTQDPGGGLDRFDLVVPPTHDRLEGPNVFPILGSPNRINLDDLAAAATAYDLAELPSPRAAVLIGGDSRRHKLTSETFEATLEALESARGEGWSLLITTSRRTPAFVVDRLRAAFAHAPHVRLWTEDADGPNPYAAFLGAADVVLATRDSTNMITEAASAGKPVYLTPMAGEDGKLALLYAELARRGGLRELKDAEKIETWPVEPLRETERAAAETVRRAQAVWGGAS
jgi:hypothetical protein